MFASPAGATRRPRRVDRGGVQRAPRVPAKNNAHAHVRIEPKRPRRLRTPPPPKIRADPSAATWRSSCTSQRRTALTPTARTPDRPVRHPAMPSPAQDHIDPPARSGIGGRLPRPFNLLEQHTGTGAIESQSVWLIANSARPARRSNDGQAILDALSAAREPGPDLRFCGAPLRNRTVDLLLTMETLCRLS